MDKDKDKDKDHQMVDYYEVKQVESDALSRVIARTKYLTDATVVANENPGWYDSSSRVVHVRVQVAQHLDAAREQVLAQETNYHHYLVLKARFEGGDL